MKLQTSIQPRSDGTVIANCDGGDYVFSANEQGDLECDVGNEQDAAALLACGNFYPADTADFDSALQMTEPSTEPARKRTKKAD